MPFFGIFYSIISVTYEAHWSPFLTPAIVNLNNRINITPFLPVVALQQMVGRYIYLQHTPKSDDS